MSLAISATILLAGAGLAIYLLILRSLEQKIFFIRLASGALFVIAALVSVLCVLGVIHGAWSVAGLAAIIISVMLGSLLWNIAFEEQLVDRIRARKAPITSTDVEKGLDWKELERWLERH